MLALIKKMPYRIRVFIFQRLLRKWNVRAASPPNFSGSLPDINNSGDFQVGEACAFHCYRLKQRISVWQGASLTIGNRCFFNDAVTICATVNISIGDYVKIGDQVHIYDSDFHQVTADEGVFQKPVVIGNNVWVGAKSMILAGTTIGDNSVIAAGSIVKGNIPANCVAAGVPAKVLKTFETPVGWVRK